MITVELWCNPICGPHIRAQWCSGWFAVEENTQWTCSSVQVALPPHTTLQCCTQFTSHGLAMEPPPHTFKSSVNTRMALVYTWSTERAWWSQHKRIVLLWGHAVKCVSLREAAVTVGHQGGMSGICKEPVGIDSSWLHAGMGGCGALAWPTFSLLLGCSQVNQNSPIPGKHSFTDTHLAWTVPSCCLPLPSISLRPSL